MSVMNHDLVVMKVVEDISDRLHLLGLYMIGLGVCSQVDLPGMSYIIPLSPSIWQPERAPAYLTSTAMRG